MGTVLPDHDEHDDLLPHTEAESEEHESSLLHSELSGVEDADELLIAQLEDQGEDLGLDLETGVEGGMDASTLVDDDDALSARDDGREALDDAFSGDASGIDNSGAEDGWTTDSEGDSELFQADFDEDEAGAHRDDGGLEGIESHRGVDDPLHEGLDERALPPLEPEDGDDGWVEEIERELIRDLGQGL